MHSTHNNSILLAYSFISLLYRKGLSKLLFFVEGKMYIVKNVTGDRSDMAVCNILRHTSMERRDEYLPP